MVNIWLYPGAASPSNVILSDPTVARGAATASLALDATEGADLASAATGLAVTTNLAATEGADLASATARLVQTLGVAAVEGADTASAGLAAVVSTALNATEGADLCDAAFSVGAGAASLAMDATEGADTCASNVVPFYLAALDAVEGADLCASSVDLVAGTADITLDATEGADECSAGMDGGQADNQTGGFRIYNLKRRKKRQAESTPEGRWDVVTTGPAVEVHADETPAPEPVEVVRSVPRDHSRWISVPVTAIRVKAPKPLENDDDHALRLLLLLAS